MLCIFCVVEELQFWQRLVTFTGIALRGRRKNKHILSLCFLFNDKPLSYEHSSNPLSVCFERHYLYIYSEFLGKKGPCSRRSQGLTLNHYFFTEIMIIYSSVQLVSQVKGMKALEKITLRCTCSMWCCEVDRTFEGRVTSCKMEWSAACSK